MQAPKKTLGCNTFISSENRAAGLYWHHHEGRVPVPMDRAPQRIDPNTSVSATKSWTVLKRALTVDESHRASAERGFASAVHRARGGRFLLGTGGMCYTRARASDPSKVLMLCHFIHENQSLATLGPPCEEETPTLQRRNSLGLNLRYALAESVAGFSSRPR